MLAIFKNNACNAQEADVFVPIAKYMETGDSERLSAWFADNLQLDILGTVNNCTRNQAKLIMKNFFANHTPKSFKIVHKSWKSPMTYAVANLDAGGSRYRVIIYVKSLSDRNEIHQIRIEE